MKKERLLEGGKGQNKVPRTRASCARLTGMLQRLLSEIGSVEGESGRDESSFVEKGGEKELSDGKEVQARLRKGLDDDNNDDDETENV